MSHEGKAPDDYFGIHADQDNHPPSAPAGLAQPSSANTSATNTSTNASATETETREKERVSQTPPRATDNDSRRGNHRDSSSRGKRKGHKDSGRDRRDSDRRPSKESTNDEGHNRRHTPKNLQPPTGTSVMDDLEEMECYHGNILEDEIQTVLKNHGDYMLRMNVNEKGDKGIVVTIIWNDEKVDLPIRAKYFETEGGKEFLYTLDSKTRCKNIKDLIRKHTMMAIPVVREKKSREEKNEVWLLNPIAKQSWELRPENVELLKKLGEGAFGEVYSGKLRLPMNKVCNVAVKVIKRSANTDAATMELQKEAAIMRKLKHINIVRFFGMVVKKDTIMVVMELINGGGLDKYLKKTPNTSIDERTGYALDLARGLAFLHEQGVMHRDIACRNCLLDMYRKIAKISDFGLARAAKEYKLRAEERIPIRWTAPEVVKTYVYTRNADIYAYAILVYEIFSNAALPFEGYTNAQIKDQIHNNDFRPKFPDNTPPKVVEIISQCWHGDPMQRMQLVDVAKQLGQLVPKDDDDPRVASPNVGKMGKSKEKLSRTKKPVSKRSKERGSGGKSGKSREFVKSVKSGRVKRDSHERKTSRERAE